MGVLVLRNFRQRKALGKGVPSFLQLLADVVVRAPLPLFAWAMVLGTQHEVEVPGNNVVLPSWKILSDSVEHISYQPVGTTRGEIEICDTYSWWWSSFFNRLRLQSDVEDPPATELTEVRTGITINKVIGGLSIIEP